MNVEIWSDLVCPFCYIGKRNWEAALERFEHRASLDVRWRSFQLDPMAPRVSDVDLHGPGIGEDRLVARTGGHRLPQPGQLHEVVGEEDVLLGGEVAEERPAGHVGLGSDIVDCHGVEAPLAEQPEGGGLEFGGRQSLPALA